MSTKMLINATHPEENRVAIVDDGILTNLDIEMAGREQTKGNIYKATVVRVEPGLQAAFIDYGGERYGFLQMGDLHQSFFDAYSKNGENKGRPRITDLLRRGQEIVVQVVKEERGTKGAALTTSLSLAGRYMVLMPGSTTKGISRKIEEEAERKKLKQAMGTLDRDSTLGYIVRTAGIGQSAEELHRDFNYLVRIYENIMALSKRVKAPALIYKESNLVIRCIRDYFSAEMDEVLVDDTKVFQEAKDFFQEVMPEYARLVKLHQERRPVFARYQIEDQIDTISRNKVPMPSGGSIVIDATEALVAVDVNSGKMSSEQGVEATAFKTNLEAATEVGRQLRLRDLGGLIVIDFIDMRDRKHIRDVEKRLKDSLKTDKARVSLGRISQFGLMEMSRQRIKATLAEGSFLPCPHCEGTGQVKNAEAQALSVLRKIQVALAKGSIGKVEAEVPLEVASYLLNAKRQELLKLEHQHGASIFIHGRPQFVAGQAELSSQKREKEEAAQPEYVEGGTLLPAIEEEVEALAAEPEAEAEAAEGKAEGEPEEEGKKKRRRRRRRRRKGAAAEGEEAIAEEAAEGEEAAKGEEKPEAAPAEVEAAVEEPKAVEAAEAAPAEGEEAKRKPARRRRTRKKPEAEEKAVEAPTPTATEEKPAEEKAAEAPAPAETEEKPAEEAEKKPARKRRTRKKPEAEEKAVEAPAPAAAEAGEKPAVAEAEEKPAEEAEKKPARKRLTTKKKAEEAVEAPAPVAAEGEVKPAEEVAEKKPARKRRTTKKTEEALEAVAAEEKPVEEAEKKPARKRRTTKKAEEAPAAVAAEEKPAKEAEKKPARKRRTTKKADEAPAAVAAEEKPAEEAEKKPARKRRTTKKAEEAPAAVVAEEKPAEETEKKPARKRRTVKKAEEAPAVAEGEKQPEEAEKKPARKKRTVKKAEEAPAVAEGEKPAEEAEKKPARKRRTTKKAEEAPAETGAEKKE